MEELHVNDRNILGTGFVTFFSDKVNHFPKHLQSGSRFPITGSSALAVEIMISRRTVVVEEEEEDISESDIHKQHSTGCHTLTHLIRACGLKVTSLQLQKEILPPPEPFDALLAPFPLPFFTSSLQCVSSHLPPQTPCL